MSKIPTAESLVRQQKALIRRQGPCEICGVSGEYAAHRLIDSEMYAAVNGMSLEDIVDAYRGSTTATAMVARWRAYLELVEERATKAEAAEAQ